MGREEYREMFSRLHTSIDEEAIIMNQKRQRKPRIAALVLAAVLVLALAAGAAAVWQHRFQDLIVLGTRTPSPDTTPQIVDPEDPRPAYEDLHLRGWSSLSLQGFAGSPEFEAAKEWAEFLDGYDRDREIWNAVNENGSPPQRSWRNTFLTSITSIRRKWRMSSTGSRRSTGSRSIREAPYP